MTNLLAPSQQIGMLPVQLPRVSSSHCSFFFFSSLFLFFLILSYWPHHGSVSLSYYTSFLLSPLPLFLVLILCAISSCHPPPPSPFLDSRTSASSYSGSGEERSQSRENAYVGVCVIWWKPPCHSPLDQGKSPAPSVKEAL